MHILTIVFKSLTLSEMFFIFLEVFGVCFLLVGCRCQILCEHLVLLCVVRGEIALSAQSSTDTHLPPLCFHLTAFPPSCQWLCFASNIHILKHCSSRLVVINMSFFGFLNTMSLNSCNAHVFNKHCQPQTSTSSFIWSLMLPQLSTYHSSLLMIYSI